MKKINLKKIIIIGLLTTSILAVTSIGASAEWKQDNRGWSYNQGGSYATGWKNIDGKWYYFYEDGYSTGYMAYNTSIKGYKLGLDGAWIQNSMTTATSIIPITAPSNWTRLAADGYSLNNGSVLAYKPKELQGYSYDKALLDVGSAIIENKNNSNVHTTYQKYNGHAAIRYEYTETSSTGSIKRNCFIVIATNSKLYGFMLCGDNDEGFENDKQNLEYVLNSTLNI
jgi:hypothetical protein